METMNVLQEKTNDLSESNNSFLKNYVLNDLSLSVFSLLFVAALSHLMNEGAVLTFSEQLAIISKPNFAGVLIASLGIFLFLKIIKDVFVTASEGKIESSKFSSIWTPIRFVILTTFVIPFEQNGIATSPAIEAMKSIIQFLAN